MVIVLHNSGDSIQLFYIRYYYIIYNFQWSIKVCNFDMLLKFVLLAYYIDTFYKAVTFIFKLQKPTGAWKKTEGESVSRSVMSDSLLSHGLQLSSVLGIFQVRILDWVAIPFSRKFSWPRDRNQVSCIAGRFFTIWVTREALWSLL